MIIHKATVHRGPYDGAVTGITPVLCLPLPAAKVGDRLQLGEAAANNGPPGKADRVTLFDIIHVDATSPGLREGYVLLTLRTPLAVTGLRPFVVKGLPGCDERREWLACSPLMAALAAIYGTMTPRIGFAERTPLLVVDQSNGVGERVEIRVQAREQVYTATWESAAIRFTFAGDHLELMRRRGLFRPLDGTESTAASLSKARQRARPTEF